MEIEEIVEICRVTSQRCVHRQYRYHILFRDRLSEADVRNVMTSVLDGRKKYYGLEYPTKYISKRGQVDLVIYDSRPKGASWKTIENSPSVFVEFKREISKSAFIQKDFVKMMKAPESVKGACFFHGKLSISSDCDRSAFGEKFYDILR